MTVSKKLEEYLLSKKVTVYSEEFIPRNAAIILLDTTSATLGKRIEDGVLVEKVLKVGSSKTEKSFQGVQAGGLKVLLMNNIEKKSKLAEHIKDVASKGLMSTYSKAMESCGMDWKLPPHRIQFSKLLNEVSKEIFNSCMDSEGGFLISSIVVGKSSSVPNEAFFNLAVSLGILEESPDEEGRLVFWKEQVNLTFNNYGEV